MSRILHSKMSVLSLGGYLSTSGGTSPLPEIIFKFNQLVQPEMCSGLWSCVISTQPYVYHVTVLYWLFLHWHFFPHYPFWHTHIELSSESWQGKKIKAWVHCFSYMIFAETWKHPENILLFCIMWLLYIISGGGFVIQYKAHKQNYRGGKVV